jgi:hypothetical protein
MNRWFLLEFVHVSLEFCEVFHELPYSPGTADFMDSD